MNTLGYLGATAGTAAAAAGVLQGRLFWLPQCFRVCVTSCVRCFSKQSVVAFGYTPWSSFMKPSRPLHQPAPPRHLHPLEPELQPEPQPAPELKPELVSQPAPEPEPQAEPPF